jgi:hypothetical protein
MDNSALANQVNKIGKIAGKRVVKIVAMVPRQETVPCEPATKVARVGRLHPSPTQFVV